MGKISVDAFLREYNVAAKQKESAVENFIKKHITTQYIPFLEKDAHCTAIIKSTCYVDKEKSIVRINSPGRYIIFVMRLIDLYTDIEISFKDTDSVEAYDKLNSVGAIDALMGGIPENERTEFSTVLNMKLDDLRDNEYSITALFYGLKKDLSLFDKVLTDAFNSPQVKEVLEKLQSGENNND